MAALYSVFILFQIFIFAPLLAVATNGNWSFQFSTSGATSGVLRARPNNMAPWGIVCDDRFNTVSAQAACRSLGLSPTGAAFRQSTASEQVLLGIGSSTLIYMDDVQCGDSLLNPFLPQCTFLFSDAGVTRHNCAYSEAVFVSCPGSAPTSAPGSLAPTTANSGSTWQASLSTGTYAGLLLVRPNGASNWGLVCDDDFYATEAQAACRSIFGTAFAGAAASTSTLSQRIGYTSATIYMDDVNCASGQLLQECSFIESTPTITRHNCGIHEAVYLSCSTETEAPYSPYSYSSRSSGTNSATIAPIVGGVFGGMILLVVIVLMIRQQRLRNNNAVTPAVIASGGNAPTSNAALFAHSTATTTTPASINQHAFAYNPYGPAAPAPPPYAATAPVPAGATSAGPIFGVPLPYPYPATANVQHHHQQASSGSGIEMQAYPPAHGYPYAYGNPSSTSSSSPYPPPPHQGVGTGTGPNPAHPYGYPPSFAWGGGGIYGPPPPPPPV